ncbi:MAG: hypothetical protein ACREQ3_02045 [Candidatus Binatia bacterium]
MRRKHLAEADKGIHDSDVDLDCQRAAQHAGKHGYALLRKGIRRRAPSTPAT